MLRSSAPTFQKAAGRVTVPARRRRIAAPVEVVRIIECVCRGHNITSCRLQTESATQRLKSLLSNKPDALGIRLGLKTRASRFLL